MAANFLREVRQWHLQRVRGRLLHCVSIWELRNLQGIYIVYEVWCWYIYLFYISKTLYICCSYILNAYISGYLLNAYISGYLLDAYISGYLLNAYISGYILNAHFTHNLVKNIDSYDYCSW